MKPRLHGLKSVRGRSGYHPDFLLLETGASIEYWGINRAGQVSAGWATSSFEYSQGIVWKRDQFRRQGKTLIESYDYERTEGTLDAALQARLAKADVVLRPVALEEIERVLGGNKVHWGRD